jgi:hypothetical protein
MTIIKEMHSAWGWAGLIPDEIVGQNDFGNLLVRDVEGNYWRICPEELGCEVVANSKAELDVLSKDQEFLHDWYMKNLVAIAMLKLGPLSGDRKYCLKIPGALGGKYEESNFETMSLRELIRASGYLAHKVRNLSDGTQVRLQIRN